MLGLVPSVQLYTWKKLWIKGTFPQTAVKIFSKHWMGIRETHLNDILSSLQTVTLSVGRVQCSGSGLWSLGRGGGGPALGVLLWCPVARPARWTFWPEPDMAWIVEIHPGPSLSPKESTQGQWRLSRPPWVTMYLIIQHCSQISIQNKRCYKCMSIA